MPIQFTDESIETFRIACEDYYHEPISTMDATIMLNNMLELYNYLNEFAHECDFDPNRKPTSEFLKQFKPL